MRIGLDFDNTIACYDELFVAEAKKSGLVVNSWKGNKSDIKRLISKVDESQLKWQKLQGKVYGPIMHKAKLFPGVARFLLRCKSLGYEVYIVSHKTKYGHFDKTKTLLRDAALNWMEANGFFKPNKFGLVKKNVFFANTQSEKVNKIQSLQLDFFVDDLEEIFLHYEFPNIKKILFSNQLSTKSNSKIYTNWTDIEINILGEITNKEKKNLISYFYDGEVENIEEIKGRGNSRVSRVSTYEKNSYLLKQYPDLLLDERPRLETEINALDLIKSLKKTPKVIAFDKNLNFALYEWIEGESVFKIEDQHIDQALIFIESLHKLSKESSFSLACESCLSANELFNQINFRLDKLLMVEHSDLKDFLVNEFMPLLDKVWQSSKQEWPNENFEKDLPKSMQFLSPSDFGFHNSILRTNGELKFIDFEYFGFDDPVKLIADFIWHPGMKLSDFQKKYWTNSAISIFDTDISIKKRFKAAWPLYGMRWSLILLNEFLKDGWTRRSYANKYLKHNLEKTLDGQFIKSKSICDEIKLANYKFPYV